MNLSQLFRTQQKDLLSAAKKLKVPRRTITEILKSKSRSFILTLLTVIITSSQSFGGIMDVQAKAMELKRKVNSGEITTEQFAVEFSAVFQDLERNVREDIENKNYNQALFYLHLYYQIAVQMGNQNLRNRVNALTGQVNEAKVTHIDIDKRGIYTDNERIYFIGIQGGFRSPQLWLIEKMIHDVNSYNNTILDMLREKFPDLFGNRISVNFRDRGIVRIVPMGPENNKTVKFVIDLKSLGDARTDSTIISRLPHLPFTP